MIRSGLKKRHEQLRRTYIDLTRFAPLIAGQLNKALKRAMTAQEELGLLETFVRVVEKIPPPPEFNIDRDLLTVKKRIRELKG